MNVADLLTKVVCALRMEFAAIQTKSAVADSENSKSLEPAKAGFVCVAAVSTAKLAV